MPRRGLKRYEKSASNGEPEKAIFRFEQAAEREQFAAEAKVLHAQVLTNEGRFAEAVPLLQAAQSINRRDDVQKLLDYVERAAARGK